MDQQGGDHPLPPPNSQSVTSSWAENHRYDDGSFNHGGGFSNNGHYNDHHRHHHNNQLHANHFHHHHHHFNHQHHQNNNFSESYDPNVHGGENVSGNSFHHPGRKRSFFHSTHPGPDYGVGGSYVKLYVRGVPRDVTEQDILSLFGNHGNIVEVVLLKDKRTGQQQESCFVKYSKIEDAERAIGALHCQYTFTAGMHPIEVKYADGEEERLGVLGTQECKVYVSFLNKQASKSEIAEIFSPYGRIQEIFLLRDEYKQNRGMGFIQFSHRDMAIAAINALNGKYIMTGCDQPLVVRFADPKKLKTGEPRPVPCFNDAVSQALPSNASYMSSQTGSEPSAVSSSSQATPASTEMADPPDCDWSEHICPDGHAYYYNCVTCESRWEKPDEYSFHEQQLRKWEHQHRRPERYHHSLSDAQLPSSQQAAENQQEPRHVNVQEVTNPQWS